MLGRIKNMKLRYKIASGAAAGALVLGGGGVAFAYFTSSGSGSSTGNTIGSATTVTLSVTNVTNLKPGLAAVPIPYSFTNTAGNGNQNFGVAHAVVSNIAPAGCTAPIADLHTFDSGSAIGTVADGATFTAAAGTEPTIQMQDTGSSQDACQGATFTVTVTATQGS